MYGEYVQIGQTFNGGVLVNRLAKAVPGDIIQISLWQFKDYWTVTVDDGAHIYGATNMFYSEVEAQNAYAVKCRSF